MYSKDILSGFDSLDQYGLENKWSKLQKDIAENMKDPFMLNEFFQNITALWRRYWQFRDEFERDVTALMDIDSAWVKEAISLNTGHAVYGDDARAVIHRMNSGKITAREDLVELAIKAKNIVSLARTLRSAKSYGDVLRITAPESYDDVIDVAELLENAIEQLIRDNTRLIEQIIWDVGRAVSEAEHYLQKYDGFTFRYNANFQGVSITISSPPFAGLPPSITNPSHNITSSHDRTTTHASVIPTYESLPYTIYIIKHGDSFWKIASEQMGNGARYEELAKYNDLTSSHVIHAGNWLKIPR